LSIKRDHTDLRVEIVEKTGTLGLTLISFALVLCVALIYQLIVGGIKIEVTGGRLIIDPSGLAFWWHAVTGR
jgi:hypothetical protein